MGRKPRERTVHSSGSVTRREGALDLLSWPASRLCAPSMRAWREGSPLKDILRLVLETLMHSSLYAYLRLLSDISLNAVIVLICKFERKLAVAYLSMLLLARRSAMQHLLLLELQEGTQIFFSQGTCWRRVHCSSTISLGRLVLVPSNLAAYRQHTKQHERAEGLAYCLLKDVQA